MYNVCGITLTSDINYKKRVARRYFDRYATSFRYYESTNEERNVVRLWNLESSNGSIVLSTIDGCQFSFIDTLDGTLTDRDKSFTRVTIFLTVEHRGKYTNAQETKLFYDSSEESVLRKEL